jgi:hypothetical protein
MSLFAGQAELLFEPPSRYAPLKRLEKFEKTPPPMMEIMKSLCPDEGTLGSHIGTF